MRQKSLLAGPLTMLIATHASPAGSLAETGQSSIVGIEQAASYFYETTLFVTLYYSAIAATAASTLHTEIHTTNTNTSKYQIIQYLCYYNNFKVHTTNS